MDYMLMPPKFTSGSPRTSPWTPGSYIQLPSSHFHLHVRLDVHFSTSQPETLTSLSSLLLLQLPFSSFPGAQAPGGLKASLVPLSLTFKSSAIPMGSNFKINYFPPPPKPPPLSEPPSVLGWIIAVAKSYSSPLPSWSKGIPLTSKSNYLFVC